MREQSQESKHEYVPLTDSNNEEKPTIPDGGLPVSKSDLTFECESYIYHSYTVTTYSDGRTQTNPGCNNNTRGCCFERNGKITFKYVGPENINVDLPSKSYHYTDPCWPIKVMNLGRGIALLLFLGGLLYGIGEFASGNISAGGGYLGGGFAVLFAGVVLKRVIENKSRHYETLEIYKVVQDGYNKYDPLIQQKIQTLHQSQAQSQSSYPAPSFTNLTNEVIQQQQLLLQMMHQNPGQPQLLPPSAPPAYTPPISPRNPTQQDSAPRPGMSPQG